MEKMCGLWGFSQGSIEVSTGAVSTAEKKPIKKIMIRIMVRRGSYFVSVNYHACDVWKILCYPNTNGRPT